MKMLHRGVALWELDELTQRPMLRTWVMGDTKGLIFQLNTKFTMYSAEPKGNSTLSSQHSKD